MKQCHCQFETVGGASDSNCSFIYSNEACQGGLAEWSFT